MIAECIIFLATFTTPEMPVDETMFVEQKIECNQYVPKSMQKWADLYYMHFEEENISTAVRIGWCESRGKSDAFNSGASDSGLMQFVSWTWNWIAEKYGKPMWNEYVITYNGLPYISNEVSKSSIGFEQIKVQFSPYYNLLMASILAEEMYGYTRWDDWTPSKWCWEDEKKWRTLWYNE